ncbi:MAG: glucans biosynthesis glucosyltransferase MdoH [Acetobacteraceae bacterium]|nr:glucans biosynthesis glucosyltransferase MdoH [Acetobacteraceae bacterium]MSP29351.1 glucans biosynthesis glucosyltransferase MdoH [Acetobacteraceae bacterium]
MFLRRLFTFALIGLLSVMLVWLAACALGSGGWSAGKILFLLCVLGTAPWAGLCAANALIGFAILLAARDPAGFVFGVDDPPLPMVPPRTAIAVTVRNEDMAEVVPPLRRLLDGLDASGHGVAFGLFILSDTQEPAAARLEEAAVEKFRAADPDPARIRYRRRAENTGFKAGNVMDFLDHHADGFEFFLALDADSEMSEDAVLRMLRAMAAEPRLAIVQHLVTGRPTTAALPRLFQFGMRAGMRVWATGQGWWQGDAGPYWGHNALLRVAPFREVCRLPKLPDGSEILSHDQVEAALLAGAGWKVRVLPAEAGSSEDNPPALPEFLRRDARWLAGNLQYFYLLAMPGFSLLGRWQLAQAILLFAGAPLYMAMFLLAAILAALGESVAAGPASVVILAWLGALYLPKLLGYVEVLVKPEEWRRYGGANRFLAGVLAEFFFILLLDAIGAVSKTFAIQRLLLGTRADWTPQNRADRGVSWWEATRMLWPHSLFGAMCFLGFSYGGWAVILWAMPLAGGLLVAIPLCVFTADPRLGTWLQQRGIASIPEELGR